MRIVRLTIFLILLLVTMIFINVAKVPEKRKSAEKVSVSPIVKQNPNAHPLSINSMKEKSYPGSGITIERKLPDGINYRQYIASYKSDGLKINALLTVPTGEKPQAGWPVILFNHGYIPPETYQTYPTVGQYASYYPYFARNGYIVFKPDFRGNNGSEGNPEGAYYSPAYTIDSLNALVSIKKFSDADSNRIGVWGHSMGGNITLRQVILRPQEIKAAVIWSGVVGSYEDLMFNWQRKVRFQLSPRELETRGNQRANLIKEYGDPRQNPEFWNSLDPTANLSGISAPIQIQSGDRDDEVPVAFSQSLRDKLEKAGKSVEYFEYPGGDHNISQNFNQAMEDTLKFFDKYLK